MVSVNKIWLQAVTEVAVLVRRLLVQSVPAGYESVWETVQFHSHSKVCHVDCYWVFSYCPCGCDRQYCFQPSFFLCMQDNSLTAALSSMKFCTNMLLDNRTNPVEFKVTGFYFRIFYHRELGKKVLA